MTSIEAIKYISDRFNLSDSQIEELKEIPDYFWLKCAKAINILKIKGYSLDINIDGLINGELKPNFALTHKYEIYHSDKAYKHSMSFEIRI